MKRIARHIVALGVAMVVASTATATATGPFKLQDAQQQQQLLKRAQEHIDKGEPEKALDVIEDLLEANDRLWVAHYLKGMAHGQMGDEKDALESFLAADEHQPGVADVYFMAGIAAFGVGDYDTCWEQTILAHQAGRDMSKEILQLSEVADPPDDLEERINAPRVLVGAMDTSVTEQNSAMESALLQIQGELAVVQQQVQRALRDSPNIGLVRTLELADYVVVVNVADYGGAATASLENRPGDVQGIGGGAADLGAGATGIGGGSTTVMGGNASLDSAQGRLSGSHELSGLIEMHDAKTSEVAFSLPMRLPDITSIGDLTRDLRRRVDLLEAWARENPNTESE